MATRKIGALSFRLELHIFVLLSLKVKLCIQVYYPKSLGVIWSRHTI